LTSEYQKIFDEILEDEVKKKARVILDEYDKDKNHLSWVNLCANIFGPESQATKETGYKLIIIDPMNSLDIKNFDLGIFRIENESLILIDCKHSVSSPESVVEDIYEAIKATYANKNQLEQIIGNNIANIEFVLVVPALDASKVHGICASKNYPICVWGLDFWKNELRLIGSEGEIDSDVLSGRVHKDKKLNRLLFRGIKSNKGLVRPITIMPSSHMCTILVQINEMLSLTMKTSTDTDFQLSDVYNTLRKEMGKITALSDEDCHVLCEKIIATALRKGVFQDLTQDTAEQNRKVFRFTPSRRALARSTENYYVQRNAIKLAEKVVVERFRSESGFRNLGDFPHT
jgi:hypothetical protein